MALREISLRYDNAGNNWLFCQFELDFSLELA
jgi:hypothetical protein